MSSIRYLLLLGLVWGSLATAAGQARRPVPSRAPAKSGAKPAVKPPPAPIEAAKRVEEVEEHPALVIKKVKLKEPVLVFYQQEGPPNAVQQLLMDEKDLPLLKTETLEKLVERREVFIDGLGNYAPPGTDPEKFRLTGVSLLASTEKRKTAPDGRSTYSRLKVPTPGDLYVVRESAEEYRHFVSGPQKKGSRIDFSVNALPGIDSVRAAYTLHKIDTSERGAGGGDIIR